MIFDGRVAVLEERLWSRLRGLARSFLEARVRLAALVLGRHGRRAGVGLNGARRLNGHVGARPKHAAAAELLTLTDALAVHLLVTLLGHVDVARRLDALDLLGDLRLLLLRDLWTRGAGLVSE